MLSARFELAIFRVSGERIDQLSHESELTAQLVLRWQNLATLYLTASRVCQRWQSSSKMAGAAARGCL